MASKKISTKIFQVAFIAVYSVLYYFLYMMLNIDSESQWFFWIAGFFVVTYPLGIRFCRKTKTNPMAMAFALVPIILDIIVELIMVALGKLPFNDLMLADSVSHHLLIVAIICAVRLVLMCVDYVIAKKL